MLHTGHKINIWSLQFYKITHKTQIHPLLDEDSIVYLHYCDGSSSVGSDIEFVENHRQLNSKCTADAGDTFVSIFIFVYYLKF